MDSFDTAEVGLFDVNFDTGERHWSPELRRILAIPNDAPAEFHLLLERVHRDDRPTVVAAAMQTFRPDCPAHHTVEFRIVEPDGKVHWVHMERGTIFRPGAGHDVVRVVGFAFEIAKPATARLEA